MSEAETPIEMAKRVAWAANPSTDSDVETYTDVAIDAIRAARAHVVARMTHLTVTKGYDHEEAWTILAAELLKVDP